MNHRCEFCSAPFAPSRSDARFCSDAHRKAAFRTRRARIEDFGQGLIALANRGDEHARAVLDSLAK